MIEIYETVLPLLGNRKYIHSTTFIKYLMSLNIPINDISIRFRSVATKPSYKLFLLDESDREDINQMVASGTLTLDNNVRKKFFFVENNDSDSSECNVIEDDIPFSMSDVLDKFHLVDFIASDSKKQCARFYDQRTHQLFMVRIDINNILSCDWPLVAETRVKSVSSRLSVTYHQSDSIIANLHGIIREKKDDI